MDSLRRYTFIFLLDSGEIWITFLEAMNKKQLQSVLNMGKDVGTKEAIRLASQKFDISQQELFEALLEKILESPDLETEFEPWRITLIEALEEGVFQV